MFLSNYKIKTHSTQSDLCDFNDILYKNGFILRIWDRIYPSGNNCVVIIFV